MFIEFMELVIGAVIQDMGGPVFAADMFWIVDMGQSWVEDIVL